MKSILISTHLLAAGLGLGLGAVLSNIDDRRVFAAGAVAGINISTIDNGLRRQGVTLSETEIKKLIETEWLKFR
jgi:hypothetical protein